MAPEQRLIKDSGNEMLAKRIVNIRRENAANNTRRDIAIENDYYDKCIEILTGLYFFTVSKDEVPALEILGKRKAISNIRKWSVFPILCLLPAVAGILWPLWFIAVYLVGTVLIKFMILDEGDILLPSLLVLLHDRRLKKFEAKLKELEGGQ